MTHVLTTNFSRGEIDPAAIDRVDQEFYQSAAREFADFWADTAGYAFSRPALETIIAESKEYEFGALMYTWARRSLRPVTIRGIEYVLILDWYERAASPGIIRVRVVQAHDAVVLLDQIVTPADYAGVSVLSTPEDMAGAVSVAQAGNSIFLASQYFLPRQIVLPETGSVSMTVPAFYAQLFGTLEPQSGTDKWLGTDTIFQDQLSPGDTVLFRGEQYTVSSVTSQTEFHTTQVYNGPSIIDRGAVHEPTLFLGADERPRLVAFFAGRLIYLTTVEKPTGMWASQTNQPFIMVPAGVEDDAPINVEYLSEGLDSFRWVVASSRLFMGSSQGEYAIGSADEGLTPATASIQKIGTSGGAQTPPATTGDIVYFVNYARTQVLAAQFDFYRQAVTTDDVSFLAPHLLRDGILQMAHRPSTGDDRTPRLLVVTSVGGLVACGIAPNQNVISWGSLNVDPYQADAVGASKTTAYVSVHDDEFVILARFGAARSGGFLLDLAQVYAAAPTVQLQTYQFDQTLGVYSSEAGFLGYFTPDVLGRIDLSGFPGLGGKLSVGLAYSPRIVLLPAVITDRKGPRLNRKRRVVRTLVDVLDTALLYINGTQVVGNAANPTGNDVSPKTGVFPFRSLGWVDQDRIEISAPAGFPATIRSITREVV